MSTGSRVPFFIAATLGLAAVVLLWSRPARMGASEARAPAGVTAREAGPVQPEASPRPPKTTPALEAPAAEAEGAFVVRVVSGGRAVAGARVRTYLRGPEDGSGRTPWRRAAEGETGADGTVRLSAAPGFYLLSAHAEGHGPARREVPRPVGETETTVELALVPGVELRGRTVAEGRGGEPVPLAEVRLRPYTDVATPATDASGLPEEEASVVSDAQGRFTLSGLTPGRYELLAEAAGFSRRTVRVLSVPREGELVVGLWAAAVLEGFVVDAQGRPAAGAEVVALGGPEPLHTSTGEGGGFSLEVPGGTYALTARQGEQVGRVPGVLVVGAGDTLRGLTVTLGAAGGLAGAVTAAAGGQPVRGARLVASPSRAAGVVGEAATGEDGRYSLDLPPGEYDVVVVAGGHTPSEHRGLAVGPGVHTPLDFKLEGRAAVEGTVADEGGRPLAGVLVRAELERGVTGRAHHTRTDASGAYRLEELETGALRVAVRRETSALWTTRRLDLTTGARERVDFTLVETGLVQGRVTQASGAPLTQSVLVRAKARTGQGGMTEWAYTDTEADGRYQLELPADVYQLTAVTPGAGYTYFHEDDLPVTVPVGAAVTADLRLGEDMGIRGVVLEPSGAPSPHATVEAIQGGDFPLSVYVETDEDGRFGLPPRGPTAAPLTLKAFNAGRLGEASEVREDGREVVLRLRAAAVLRGRVLARGGGAVDGFTLQLLEADGSVPPWSARGGGERTFTGDSFALYDAPAQALRVDVRTRDGRVGHAAVKLAPGQEARVDVLLEGGTTFITGRAVWSSSGAPAEGVSVFLDRQVSAQGDVRTGPDGRFRLDDVRPGVHTVRLLAPDGRPETRTVKVAEGEAVELGDVTVAARRATPGTVGAGFSEERGHISFAWLTPEGPAARAGMRVGDRLLAVDGVAVRNRQEAESRTRGTPGTPVRLNVRRTSGEEQQVQLSRAD